MIVRQTLASLGSFFGTIAADVSSKSPSDWQLSTTLIALVVIVAALGTVAYALRTLSTTLGSGPAAANKGLTVGLRKKRRMQIIAIALIMLMVSVGLIGFAFRDGINFFRSPTQVAENPPPPTEVFRIGGLVVEGSLVRGQGETVRFEVTDTNRSVPVVYTGILPDLFGEGQGMVGTGRFVDGVFEATEILAKHDENYMPKEVIDALKEQGTYVKPGS